MDALGLGRVGRVENPHETGLGGQNVLEPFTGSLPGHLDQPKFRNAGHLTFCMIPLKIFFQHSMNLTPVFFHNHIDKIQDNDAAQVS